MKKKPLYFNFLSLLLAGIAGSFPVQIILEYDYAASDWLMAFDHLTYVNYAVMILCFIVAYDSYVVSARLKYTSVALIALTVINNALVGYVAINYSMSETVMASLFFVLPFIYLLKPEIRILLNDSNHHEWKTNPKSLNTSQKVMLVNVQARSADKCTRTGWKFTWPSSLSLFDTNN